MRLLKRPAWGGGAARPWWNGLVGKPCPTLPVLCPAVDHVVPEPESSLAEALERWREWADGKACCDYALHVDIPRWSDHIKQELHTMVQEKGLLPATPCLALATPVPWPGRARGGCAVGCPRGLAQLPAGLCPTGQLVGRVARTGSLTYPAHLSLLSPCPRH